MSGVEAVLGLILGVIPLLISALEHYKEGISTIECLWKYQISLARLIRRLRAQETHFTLNLQILVKSALPDLDGNVPISELTNTMWKGNVGVHIKCYLGPAFESFQEHIVDYQACMQAIAKKLRHMNRPFGAKKDDLAALLKANPPGLDGKFQFRKAIDFTMKKSDLEHLIDKLKETNLTLSSFLKDSETLNQPAEASAGGSQSQAKDLVRWLEAVREHASNLYSALSGGCTTNGCDKRHRAMLHLEDRLDLLDHKLLRGTKQKVKFRLAIAHMNISGATQHLDRQDTVINVPDHADWMGSTLNVIVEPPHLHPIGTQIPSFQQFVDLCSLISRGHPQLHLNLDASMRLCHRKSHHQSHRLAAKTGPTTEVIPLERVLTNSSRLSCKQSTKLALKLASSVIQLHSTDWQRSNWNKNVIEFFHSEHPIAITNLEQPLLSKEFDGMVTTPPHQTSSTAARLDLLDLGILLLELWHQKTFETFITESGSIVTDSSYYSRMPVAIRWFDTTADDLPLKYRDVVSRCVRFSFEGCTPSWDDAEFRRIVCQNVVAPLHETCRIW